MTTFEDETPSTHRMKVTFLCTLRSWANLYSVDNTDSLVDYLTLLGVYINYWFFIGSPLYISSVLFGNLLFFFYQYTVFYR